MNSETLGNMPEGVTSRKLSEDEMQELVENERQKRYDRISTEIKVAINNVIWEEGIEGRRRLCDFASQSRDGSL